MKKILLLLVVVSTAFIMVISSCTKEADKQEEEVVENSQENPSEIEMGDGVHSITLSFPETKTAFGESEKEGGTTYYKKNWTAGDQICINGQPSLELLSGNIDETKSIATFYFDEPIKSSEAYQVVYPASAYDSETGEVTIPANQIFYTANFDKDADIILGYGTDLGSITLSNAVAYLKIKLTKGDYGNFGVKSVKITAEGKKLNGAFEIADGGLGLTVPSSTETSAEQTITLDASAMPPLLGGSETVFLLAVAPQVLSSGFTVTITDTKDNTMEKTKASSVTLDAGGILAMPAFKFQEYHAIASPEDLLAFADSCSVGNSNYWLVIDNIDMKGETWPVAGTADDDSHSFKGTLDGGNNGDDSGCSIQNLSSTTGSFINFVGTGANIKNVTLASTCSIAYSTTITSTLFMGAIAGRSHGAISNCFNNASVSCTSTNYSDSLYIGGIVGLQEKEGPISGCRNNANISCSSTNGSKTIYMGGIAGAVFCNGATAKSTVTNSTNYGTISRGNLTANSKNSKHYVGGIIGWLKVGGTSYTFSGLKNYGDVSGPNYQTATNKIPQFVGGLIGAFHGEGSSDGGRVKIESSEVKNCTIKNEFRNNGTDGSTGGAGYNFQCHNGAVLGMGRGSDGNVTLEHIDVDNVVVYSSRGFAGGLCGWIRGATIKNCNVINSQVSGAQVFRGGGIAGCMYTSIVDRCTVKLSKTSTLSDQSKGSSLWAGSSAVCQQGGITGWLRGTCEIKNSKTFIYNMSQTSVDATVRGFIVGTASGSGTTGTIQDCSMGGTLATYNSTLRTFTVTSTLASDEDITDDIIRGSSSAEMITIKGTNEYWDGTL